MNQLQFVSAYHTLLDQFNGESKQQTNYSKTSSYARIKLVKQLAILERTIYEIQKEIEEAR